MCPPVITHVYSYQAETERFPPRAYGRNMWKVHTEIFFVTTQHLAGDMLPSQFTVEKQRSNVFIGIFYDELHTADRHWRI